MGDRRFQLVGSSESLDPEVSTDSLNSLLDRTIGGFADTLLDKDANRAAYDYWAQKTRPRIKDPKKRDLLVPLEQPYYYATKRPSLEQDYYEMCDRDNVEITKDPITHFTETRIATGEKTVDFDVVAVCTGYDAITGGLMTMNIRGKESVNLHDKWYAFISALKAEK